MCECAKNTGVTPGGVTPGAGVPVPLTHGPATLSPIAERAVLCWACPHARDVGGGGGGGPVAWLRRIVTRSGRWCGVSGAPIMEHLARGECPRSRFRREDRTASVAGVAWRGLPMPLRWLAWALGPGHVRPGAWHGCGCVARAKDLWERVVGHGATH